MEEPKKNQLHEKRLLDLGKKLEEFYNAGYVNKKRALGFSFLKGLAYGLGIVIGGTLVIGVALWILSLFKQVPLLGPITDNVKHTLQLRVK